MPRVPSAGRPVGLAELLAGIIGEIAPAEVRSVRVEREPITGPSYAGEASAAPGSGRLQRIMITLEGPAP